jgi:hypothetical protein
MDDVFDSPEPSQVRRRDRMRAHHAAHPAGATHSTAGAAPPPAPQASPRRATLSPGALRLERGAQKRAAAAAFIEEVLPGSAVPAASDAAFRAALADGLLLTRLLHAIAPGAAPPPPTPSGAAPGGVRGAFERLQAFLAAARALGAGAFAAADLEDLGGGERPQVAECVLSLRDWAAAPRPGPGGRATPSPSGGAATTNAAFSFTPAAAGLVARHGAGPGPAGLDADGSDGLAYLMRSCTHLLKSRMGVPATPLPPRPAPAAAPADVALDAVGPVLEAVLGNLTAEYERRLLGKDQEAKAAAAAVGAARREAAAARAEAARWRAAAEAAAPAADAAAADALRAQEREELARLRAAETERACELAAARRTAAAGAAGAAAAAEAAAAEAAALRAEAARGRAAAAALAALRAENRAMYNALQDARGAVRVFCRVRPRGATGDAGRAVVEAGPEEGALALYSERHARWADFRFDAVFGEGAPEGALYAEAAPLVRRG